MKRKTKENLSLSENIFLLCTIIYYIALYRQRKVCLVDQEEGRSERGLRLGQKEGKMGQTGSRVATKIANSFTFHGSPRFNVKYTYV